MSNVLLTALVFLRTTKQMKVHILEANTRKALNPICNCFNIGTFNLVRALIQKSEEKIKIKIASPFEIVEGGFLSSARSLPRFKQTKLN